MIRWVFFDVGNVIFNDDPFSAAAYELLYQAITAAGHALTFKDLVAEREALVLADRTTRDLDRLARKHLPPERVEQLYWDISDEAVRNYSQYNLPLSGIVAVLQAVAAKYPLGIIANQPVVCRRELERWGFLQYFKLVGISDEVGLAKPDPQFFLHMLDQAGCRPEEAVMIGDTIANDVRPARKLGLHTIWVNIHHRDKGYVPPTDHARIYFESQCRLRDQLPPAPSLLDEERPDVTVGVISEIPKAVNAIASTKTSA